jgi:hypothetical protein
LKKLTADRHFRAVSIIPLIPVKSSLNQNTRLKYANKCEVMWYFYH